MISEWYAQLWWESDQRECLASQGLRFTRVEVADRAQPTSFPEKQVLRLRVRPSTPSSAKAALVGDPARRAGASEKQRRGRCAQDDNSYGILAER